VEEEGADFCRGEGKLSAGAVGVPEEGAATSVAAGRRRNQRAKGSGRSLFLEEKTMERKKKKGGYGAGLSSFTAGVRRMTDWEGWLCLGEKEQENGAGLREEENAGTGWRGREAEGKWPCVGEL
jgi:hypothetical protein